MRCVGSSYLPRLSPGGWDLAPNPQTSGAGCCGVKGPDPQPLSIRTHVFGFAAILRPPRAVSTICCQNVLQPRFRYTSRQIRKSRPDYTLPSLSGRGTIAPLHRTVACPSEAFEANMFPDTAPRPARILLCDDSPVERLALAHFLRGA